MRPTTGITVLGFRLGVVALAGYWLVLFLGTHWPASVKISVDVHDKVQHFGGFFVLALLSCYVTNSAAGDRAAATKRFLGIFFALAVYACIDEATQAFSPGRHPDVFDALADIGGVITAITIYLLAKSLLPRPADAAD